MAREARGMTRIAVVTGGNKGIGFETVRALARAGMTVLLGARDVERGTAAVKELAGEGDVRFLRLEVTDADSVARAAGEIESEFGRLDVLVNNAGITGGMDGDGEAVFDLGGDVA